MDEEINHVGDALGYVAAQAARTGRIQWTNQQDPARWRTDDLWINEDRDHGTLRGLDGTINGNWRITGTDMNALGYRVTELKAENDKLKNRIRGFIKTLDHRDTAPTLMDQYIQYFEDLV